LSASASVVGLLHAVLGAVYQFIGIARSYETPMFTIWQHFRTSIETPAHHDQLQAAFYHAAIQAGRAYDSQSQQMRIAVHHRCRRYLAPQLSHHEHQRHQIGQCLAKHFPASALGNMCSNAPNL
jgi:hypothetical protein